MLELRCCVSRINYADSLESIRSVFERYHIPMFVGRFALFLMPDWKKQQLLISLTNRYNARILHILQDFADKNNIRLNFQNLKLEEGAENIVDVASVTDMTHAKTFFFFLFIKNLSFVETIFIIVVLSYPIIVKRGKRSVNGKKKKFRKSHLKSVKK